MNNESIGDCVFSECRTYRYVLTRLVPAALNFKQPEWCGTVQFIGLNPSTADETKNDRTISKLIRYASKWGFNRLNMTNLFAYRATDPEVMKKHSCPVGPDNDAWILTVAKLASCVIAGWGNHGSHMGRDAHVKAILATAGITLYCLETSKEGNPKHPLYLKETLTPIPFEVELNVQDYP